MIKSPFLLFFLALIGLNQSSNGQIIQKSIEKIKISKFIYYTSVSKYKDPFDDGFSTDTIKAFIGIKPAHNEAGGYFKLETSKQRVIYDGNSLIRLNLPDNTYSLSKEVVGNQLYRNSLLYYLKYLREIIGTPSKVKRLADTLINAKLFYHLRINELDSVINGENVFAFTELVIDKKSHLPLFIKTENQGFLGTTLVRIASENSFSNYRMDQEIHPDAFLTEVPATFTLETSKKSMSPLAKGLKAPAIELYDTFGNLFELETSKGKVVLLNFTTNGCPHSVEAIKSLNKIYKKYQDSALSIMSINISDNMEDILKFNKKFDVHFPTYLNGNIVADTYHVDSYPTFYLIDKKGNIYESFTGYYPALEEQLIDKIDALN